MMMAAMAAVEPNEETNVTKETSTSNKHPLDEILDGALSRSTAEKVFIGLVAATSSYVSYSATEAFGAYGGKGADLSPHHWQFTGI